MVHRYFLAMLLLPLLVACDRWRENDVDPRTIYDLSDAGFLRPQVDAAIAIANDVLEGAGIRTHLRSSWTPRPKASMVADTEIIVYLLRQPVAAAVEARLLQGVAHSMDKFWTEQGRAQVNENARDCRDFDDCVETQYSPEMGRSFDALYENRTALEIAVQQARCRCIVLFQSDLERFDLIFGRNSDKSPSVPLVWHLPTILLHELGHNEKNSVRPKLTDRAEAAYQRMEAMLTGPQREEVRADAFVATAMRKRCFTGEPVSWDVSQSCMATAAHGVSVFMQDLFGKSKEGLCRQYLPVSDTHPNYMLRQLAIGVVIYPEHPLSTKLFTDFLDTQDKILAKNWINNVDICRTRRLYYAHK